MPFVRLGRFAAASCGLASGVFHAFGPANHSRSVTHLDHRFRRNQIEVEHLVARRAEKDKIADVVVLAVAIKVSYLQDFRNAESTMRTKQPILVVFEGKLAIVDAVHRGRPG